MKLVSRRNSVLLWVLGALLLAGRADAATSYDQMTRQLQDDARNSPFIQVVSLGKSSSGARTVWLVRIGLPEPQAAKQRSILALCRQHGDEPASTEALLRLTHQVAVHGLSAWPGGKHVVLYAVPMVNPDGADAGKRLNAAGADLNRDWGVFSQPETRAVYQAYKTLRPDLVLDLHSWDTSDPFRRMCIEAPRSAKPMPLESALANFQNRAVIAGTAAQERIAATTYGADADPDLAHRFFWTVKRTSALLFETDAGSQNPDVLVRRTQAAYLFLTWAISDATKNSPSWVAFASASRPSDDTLFERVAKVSPTALQSGSSRPKVVWHVWMALICCAVGVFWRYGLVRWDERHLRRSRRSAHRAKPSRKERLREARIEAVRRTRTPHDDRRPQFRFAQPDQRSRDARRPDLSRRDLAWRIHEQVH